MVGGEEVVVAPRATVIDDTTSLKHLKHRDRNGFAFEIKKIQQKFEKKMSFCF